MPAVIPAAYSGGGAISATKYNPYVQGTASTADGFLTTSTGPYAPDLGAGILVAPNGSQAWWAVSVLQPTTQVLSVDSAVQQWFSLGMSTTGSNTHVQICPWAVFPGSTPSGSFELQTYQTQDLFINAGSYPNFQTFSTTSFLSGSANVSLFGYAIRVLSSTDDVYIGQMSHSARQVKI